MHYKVQYQSNLTAGCLLVKGKQPIVLLRERVFNSIGIMEADWLRSRQGNWNGVQILSEDIIDQTIVNDPLLSEIPVVEGQDDFRRRGYGWQMIELLPVW